MKTLEGVTMPQVRSSKNRSLLIKADVGQELGIDPNRTFNVVKQGENLLLEPVKDPLEAQILADVAEGMQAIREGRCSPAFEDMDEMEKWLDAELKK